MEYCINKMALDVTSKSLFVKHGGGERIYYFIRSNLGHFFHASHPFSQGRIIIIKVDNFVTNGGIHGDKGLDLRVKLLPCTSLFSTLLLRKKKSTACCLEQSAEEKTTDVHCSFYNAWNLSMLVLRPWDVSSLAGTRDVIMPAIKFLNEEMPLLLHHPHHCREKCYKRQTVKFCVQMKAFICIQSS